ncbi:putative RNA binding protein Ligatin/Tma64 [Taphrina deformans PYCC 5710]|uniref:RNA binding protein Ligatin/Tma64 n=1 Tax=Taphrina deformans (strain PYCC 5710 / ATCC 11124 / CBS 356.35 / IMI 108563 / JCM 9778 / NBRC 8474) TaxID=1097556 RepID=R4XD96_TAPDE|nr:putative RNA binding protein Ligatin/Tma64 [Taphrina deformans PYCC 5710]|eukprot:CCG82378.1 putative RNA binding protein Ligatin/Tma64 [Taphrina deformans PYCC 5710]
MFKKQATYKSATAIRNSERKSLVADVRRIYAPTFEDKSEEDIKEIVDLILPASGIEASTYTSTKGHRGTLYSCGNVAIFIRFETHLVPTLHTFWKCPDLTTTVLTGSQVLGNLQAGSDLMVKGMFEYSSRVKAGEVVGIRITGKSHIVAVGLAAVDFDKVNREAGGKGLLLVTCLGDTVTPESAYPTEDNIAQEVKLNQDISSLSLTENEPDTKSVQVEDEGVQEEFPGLSTAEIDAAFSQALLFGLHAASGAQQEIQLPIPSSTLVDAHVLPFLPSRHPDLVFKKTSFTDPVAGKKASKFLTKQKFLKTKETKGQLNITGIDWQAPEISSFAPYKLPSPTVDSAEKARVNPESGTEKKVIQVEELYRPPSSTDTLLGTDGGGMYSRLELSGMMDRYYAAHGLVTTNPKMITVDPELFHAVVPKTSSQRQLSRDVLLRGLIRLCAVHHRIDGGKIRKGPVPDLEIVMESRQGKKSVTRLLHLDRFLPSPTDVNLIMDELKRKCAVSVSIGEVKGTKPGSSVEVMVQGKKSTEVVEVLETWGVRKAWIKVLDKTK